MGRFAGPSGISLYNGWQSSEPIERRAFIMHAEMKTGEGVDITMNFAVRITSLLLIDSEAFGMHSAMPRHDGLELLLANVAPKGDS